MSLSFKRFDGTVILFFRWASRVSRPWQAAWCWSSPTRWGSPSTRRRSTSTATPWGAWPSARSSSRCTTFTGMTTRQSSTTRSTRGGSCTRARGTPSLAWCTPRPMETYTTWDGTKISFYSNAQLNLIAFYILDTYSLATIWGWAILTGGRRSIWRPQRDT